MNGMRIRAGARSVGWFLVVILISSRSASPRRPLPTPLSRQNGDGQFKSIQDAINAAPQQTSRAQAAFMGWRVGKRPT